MRLLLDEDPLHDLDVPPVEGQVVAVEPAQERHLFPGRQGLGGVVLREHRRLVLEDTRLKTGQ